MPRLGEFVIIAFLRIIMHKYQASLNYFIKTMSSQNTRFTRQAGTSKGVSRGSYYIGKSSYIQVQLNTAYHFQKKRRPTTTTFISTYKNNIHLNLQQQNSFQRAKTKFISIYNNNINLNLQQQQH